MSFALRLTHCRGTPKRLLRYASLLCALTVAIAPCPLCHEAAAQAAVTICPNCPEPPSCDPCAEAKITECNCQTLLNQGESCLSCGDLYREFQRCGYECPPPPSSGSSSSSSSSSSDSSASSSESSLSSQSSSSSSPQCPVPTFTLLGPDCGTPDPGCQYTVDGRGCCVQTCTSSSSSSRSEVSSSSSDTSSSASSSEGSSQSPSDSSSSLASSLSLASSATSSTTTSSSASSNASNSASSQGSDTSRDYYNNEPMCGISPFSGIDFGTCGDGYCCVDFNDPGSGTVCRPLGCSTNNCCLVDPVTGQPTTDCCAWLRANDKPCGACPDEVTL